MLFGTATEDQINKVEEGLSQINDMSKENLRKLNIVTSIVNINTQRVSKLKNVQIKIANDVSRLYNNLANVTIKINVNSEQIQLEHIINRLSFSFIYSLVRMEIHQHADNLFL